MLRVYILLILLFSMFGCTSANFTSQEVVEGEKPELSQSEYQQWSHMLGTWFGSQSEVDGSRYDWIVIRDSYGRYKLISRHYGKTGSYDEYTEFGEWGIAGPIYFVITRSWPNGDGFEQADMSDPSLRHAYQVISITENEFKYKAYSDGSNFRMGRVADGYTFEQ